MVQTVIPVRAELLLPVQGQMVALSPAFNPPVLKGIKVYPDNPLRFDFSLDKGDDKSSDDQIKTDSTRLIKYFLASLTIPEKDLWVNLSPYEKDRIVPEAFGQTEMGRDLLAQDYLLKQITASLLYPEGDIGKKFWKKIYALAQEKYGTTDIPVDTFNKVWIVPEKAVVYENGKVGAAYVTESRLKVMLESDYLAQEKNVQIGNETNEIAKEVMRAVVIPELEREVNEGKNFAKLRQVYQSLILAAWYKKKIKQSLLSAVYVDRNKTAGVNIKDPKEAEKIWWQYVEVFKKGAYNFVKEERDMLTDDVLPRKYFSGGADLAMTGILKEVDFAELTDLSGTLVSMRASPVLIHGQSDDIDLSQAIFMKWRKDIDAQRGLEIRKNEDAYWLTVYNSFHVELEAIIRRVFENYKDENQALYRRVVKAIPQTQYTGWDVLHIVSQDHKFLSLNLKLEQAVFDVIGQTYSLVSRYPNQYRSILIKAEHQMQLLVHQYKSTGKQQLLNLGTIGAGLGFEPVDMVLRLHQSVKRVTEQNSIPEDAIDFKVVVMDQEGVVYRKVRENRIVYSNEIFASAVWQDYGAYFNEGLLGKTRGSFLEEHLHFITMDLTRPNTWRGVPHFDGLLAHNVLQYVRPRSVRMFFLDDDGMYIARVRKADPYYEALVKEMVSFLDSRVVRGGFFSLIFSVQAGNPILFNELSNVFSSKDRYSEEKGGEDSRGFYRIFQRTDVQVELDDAAAVSESITISSVSDASMAMTETFHQVMAVVLKEFDSEVIWRDLMMPLPENYDASLYSRVARMIAAPSGDAFDAGEYFRHEMTQSILTVVQTTHNGNVSALKIPRWLEHVLLKDVDREDLYDNEHFRILFYILWARLRAAAQAWIKSGSARERDIFLCLVSRIYGLMLVLVNFQVDDITQVLSF